MHNDAWCKQRATAYQIVAVALVLQLRDEVLQDDRQKRNAVRGKALPQPAVHREDALGGGRRCHLQAQGRGGRAGDVGEGAQIVQRSGNAGHGARVSVDERRRGGEHGGPVGRPRRPEYRRAVGVPRQKRGEQVREQVARKPALMRGGGGGERGGQHLWALLHGWLHDRADGGGMRVGQAAQDPHEVDAEPGAVGGAHGRGVAREAGERRQLCGAVLKGKELRGGQHGLAQQGELGDGHAGPRTTTQRGERKGGGGAGGESMRGHQRGKACGAGDGLEAIVVEAGNDLLKFSCACLIVAYTHLAPVQCRRDVAQSLDHHRRQGLACIVDGECSECRGEAAAGLSIRGVADEQGQHACRGGFIDVYRLGLDKRDECMLGGRARCPCLLDSGSQAFGINAFLRRVLLHPLPDGMC